MSKKSSTIQETRVLIVENTASVAQDLQQTLENLGYTVLTVAASGEAALQKAAESWPDLVLTDVVVEAGLRGVVNVALGGGAGRRPVLGIIHPPVPASRRPGAGGNAVGQGVVGGPNDALADNAGQGVHTRWADGARAAPHGIALEALEEGISGERLQLRQVVSAIQADEQIGPTGAGRHRQSNK